MSVASVSEVYGLLACGLTGHARAAVRERSDRLSPERANEDEFVRALQLRASITTVLLLFSEIELLRECRARGLNALAPLRRETGEIFMTAHEVAAYHCDAGAHQFLNEIEPAHTDGESDRADGVELFDHVVGIMAARSERGDSARSIRRASTDRVRKIADALFPGGARNMELYKRFMSPFTFVRVARALGLACCIYQGAELVAEFEQTTPRRRMAGVDQTARDMEGPRFNVSARLSEDLGPAMFTSNPVPVRDAEGALVAVRVAIIPGPLIKPYLIRTLVQDNGVQLPDEVRSTEARAIYARDAELRGEELHFR
jgi:hypothetical protein